jgi:hypothetical protein
MTIPSPDDVLNGRACLAGTKPRGWAAVGPAREGNDESLSAFQKRIVLFSGTELAADLIVHVTGCEPPFTRAPHKFSGPSYRSSGEPKQNFTAVADTSDRIFWLLNASFIKAYDEGGKRFGFQPLAEFGR